MLTRLFIGGVLMLVLAFNAQATKIETLIMPGEVIAGHAEYESECARCHERFSKTDQNRLCLDCHKDVNKDLAEKQGFHGRMQGLRDQECKQCHTDHKGRDADIVKLNRDSFDHKLADFELKGAHTALSCSSCHVADKLFREAPSACVDCHRKTDPHKKRLGEKCADCHVETSWKKTDYDHDKTDFALKGKHREVICSACHPNQRYENTPSDCNSCHALNDVHRGRNGTKCADCHDEQRWDKARFDHTKDTDFPLRDSHSKLACETCHTDALVDKKLATTCIGCHRADDTHHGRNGERCETCHSEKTWTESRFDHSLKTDFPLKGKHKEVLCNTCHRGSLTDKLETGCIDCHRADDVHLGKQGEDCARCHRETGWGDEVVFDHDLTKFPLIGLHATAPCEECHASSTFQDVATRCADCHGQDDIHKQALGDDCARCHNPNGWAFWQFDHDTTDFKLEGSHRGLVCKACHRDPIKGHVIDQSKLCVSCHAADDKHRGRYGKQCERCHDQESFGNVSMQP
ncbi:MAG TPA: cytochrome c3 family protein [Gammaproteobacteria bacterium]|nr:cytochrome c3 family protein [Gammaproteobacteria bacterium]